MIKIEITDVEKLDPSVLRATGRYLLDLSGADDEQIEASPLHKHVEKIMSSVNIPELNEEARTARETAEDIGRSLAMAHLKEADAEKDIIPEEYIFVPAETVVAPCPAQIFAAPAPVPPVAVSPVPAVAQPGVELDTEGLPWDMRIHARTKTKMKDGSWKKLRGIGPDVVKRVEAELKAVQSLPAAVAPVAPVTPAVPPAPVALGFMDLMSLVTKAITEGSLKRDQVTEVLGRSGIASLPLVAARPDLIPEIMAALQGVINGSQ